MAFIAILLILFLLFASAKASSHDPERMRQKALVKGSCFLALLVMFMFLMLIVMAISYIDMHS